VTLDVNWTADITDDNTISLSCRVSEWHSCRLFRNWWSRCPRSWWRRPRWRSRTCDIASRTVRISVTLTKFVREFRQRHRNSPGSIFVLSPNRRPSRAHLLHPLWTD
jgi:hypothetical protein